MARAKLIAISGAVLIVAIMVMLATAHRTIANPSTGADIALGPALAPAHSNATTIIQQLKDQGAAALFAHADRVVTQFGSRTPTVKLNGSSLPAKDYWTVHLIGLKSDSQGHPLLMYHGAPNHPAPPLPTSVTFVVDDQTGQIVEVDY